MVIIKHKIMFFLLVSTYFILYRLLLSHFKKKLNLEFIFSRPINFIFKSSIISFFITVFIFIIFIRDSLGLNFNSYLNDIAMLSLLTFYHISTQLIFQKNRIDKYTTIILSSSIIAYIIIILIIGFYSIA